MGRAFEVRKAAMAKTAAAKTKVYSRYGKEIYLAAKNGEPNPEMNLELSRIIDKAKADQVPNDIIKRAIEKAKGGIDEHYDAIRYEGFGPGSSTLIIDALTNNTNRTFGEVRNCFTKTNTKIGVSNSVSYLYNHVGILTFNFNDEDSVLETLILNDVDVVEIESEEDLISVLVNPKDLYLAKETLEKELHIKQYETLELSMIPLDFVTLDDQQMEVFNKLISMLEDCEDVSHIYHNVSL